MKPLKIGITGVRGIVGETFTPELAVEFAEAFGTYLDRGRILVCRDTRPSGPMIRSAVLAGLLAAGCEVIDVGICPTPSMQLAVKWLKAEGGIAITAGHNPGQWNALKFVRGDGLYLNPTQGEELLDIFHQGEFAKATWDTIKQTVHTVDPIEEHIKVLRESFAVEAIREKRLTVAVDCCNGACSFLSPKWLATLGCEVLAVNDDPNAPFPHTPEPKRETMAQLCAVVKAGRAAIGFAHDADGERLGIVTDLGEPLSEEMTLAIAAAIRLRKKTGTVVTNVSSSNAVDIIAARHGGSVIRTPVGQAYISEGLIEYDGVLGGEGSGGITVPEVHLTHDSAAAIGLILEHLAQTGERISELVNELPRLTILKHNVAVEPHRLYSVLQEFRAAMEQEGIEVDSTDGIKVMLPGGWVHVRASNTESMIRIIVEAEEPAAARELLDWARDRIRKP
ncbi:MAG TPA: phosphoglucosamine mutase [Pyrinomonadaceae bacterium]|nr:phosphoglucosamine mutase [Pyrinomonadaceae bacterium]